MSWTAWTSLVPTLLIISAVSAWWFTEPKNARVNLIAAAGVLLFCWAVAPDFSRHFSASVYTSLVNGVSSSRLDLVIVKNAKMLLTGAAAIWLMRRAWQTLWKPVPELISILGVDVPDRPDVSLAGIRADAATLNWSRPSPNRPVQRFLIQVNGVVVGDVAANQEPAIVVSGLKPDHFYNVRVIAVGSNNFQAGSRVIRLRTFGKDGRPRLGTSRLPANFAAEEQPRSVQGDQGDESGTPRSPLAAVDATNVDPATASTAGPRRNTVTRRHSPSTASQDAPSTREDSSGQPAQTLAELTEKFESIRRETEETAALMAKEEVDNKRQLDELEAEKQEKKKEQKKKEEQTEKLKREVHSTDRAMRNAQQRRAQKEKQLKEKMDQRAKFQDNIAKWEKSIDDMRREMEGFESQRKDLAEERDTKLEDFQQANGDLQQECCRLEVELKEKREQVKELEDARKKLPGGEEDEEWRDDDVAFRRECQRRQKDLHDAVISENRNSKRLDEQIRVLSMQLGHIPGAQTAFPMYNQANSSGLDFETSLSQLKRRSRNSNSLSNVSISSPLPPYSQIDPAAAPVGYNSSRANAPPGFAQGPFMSLAGDMPRPLDEEGIRMSSAPLSPSATALLPSNILDDIYDEPSPTSNRFDPDPFSTIPTSPIDDPQSPPSSRGSMSILSSPRGSTHNLPFPTFSSDHSEGRSQNTADNAPSPAAAEPPINKLSSFFNFQRSRHAKPADDGGPVLGSLKQGQSQSFPRQLEEGDALTNRRRISLSGTWSKFNRNSAGPELIEGLATKAFSARTFNPFSSSHRTGASNIYSDRDPSSPRPGSTASNEFPRPSTDSSSIWGPQPTDQATLGKQSRFWSPDAVPAAWSRNPSRRPSLHGSPSALKTTLASADDEILDEDTLPNASEVGVIGSKLPTSSRAASFARLNPNAPAFIGSLFQRGKSEKDSGKEKDKTKGKDKDKTKDKSKDKHKGADTPVATPSESESPSDRRQSRDTRDTLSVHTQASVNESHDSLSLSLDQSVSNISTTPSEPAGLGTSLKDENVVRKLFRKSSSSKFSLPGRLGVKDGSSLFKKGTGSSVNSDKGERSSMGDGEDIPNVFDEHGLLLGKSYDSVTSSPSLGPTLSNKTSRDSKTGTARWLSFSKKPKKEKESLDLERDKERVVESQSEAGDDA
ncbi:hypothetical protein BR93DRAFT_928588 [Coniochaeta sp. PMI_546]|nr:hypothetical protein BR93DRAFT_928588 [Coniochaeta sp. PMI_546]